MATLTGTRSQIMAASDSGMAMPANACRNGIASVYRANQRWRLQPADGSGTVLVVSVNSGKCLDLPAGQTGPGVALQQWSCQGGQNQKWSMVS